jgi:chaperonin cofactor prefoldin
VNPRNGEEPIVMETLQCQIDQLNQQITTLNQAIENLTRYISELMNDRHSHATPYSLGHHNDLVGHSSHGHYRGDHSYQDLLADNKDVLIDGDGIESMTSHHDRVMSPELQIQRLTAQLTAAYNRIAALEEQLLARRVS